MRKLSALLITFAFGWPMAAQAGDLPWPAPMMIKQAASPAAPARPAEIARYGPFRAVSADRATMAGVTDSASPGQFAAMLRDYPAIRVLEMVDCPGTEDDLANLQLGRMIRSAGISTRVAGGGSVRSGAVELFLAGAAREMEDGAEFAVHAWIDEEGREASQVPAGSVQHRQYLSYYREMGMNEAQATAFYAMTNAASFATPRWLTGKEMRRWIDAGSKPSASAPTLAYLDLGSALH